MKLRGRFRIWGILALGLFLVAIAYGTVAYLQKQNAESLQIADADQVVSIRLIPAHGGASDKFIALNLNEAQDERLAAAIVKQLQKGKRVGPAADSFFSMGGSPNQLEIVFKNGESILAEDALVATVKKQSNGSTEVQSASKPDQITVYQHDQMWRIVAPELKTWLEADWSQAVPELT